MAGRWRDLVQPCGCLTVGCREPPRRSRRRADTTIDSSNGRKGFDILCRQEFALPNSSLEALLGLSSPPVSITFTDTPPPGVAHVAAAEPAGCGYWRRAAAGEVFYTDADDHKRCPVGAHTHNVPLTQDEKQELMGLVG